MPGPYNPGQAAIRVVTVNPDNTDATMPSVTADGSTKTVGANGTSAATAANPAPTRDYGSASIATSQVAVGTSATQIVAARSGRLAVTVTMLGAGDIFLGASGVTVSNGTLLLGTKGSSVTVPTQAALFGIGAAGQSVSVLETF